MSESPETVIKNAYLQDRDRVVDIAIDGGKITAIGDPGSATGETEIDAKENLVSPGFVDSHKHIDRAFAIAGDRKPKEVDDPEISGDINAQFDRHYDTTPFDEIVENAVRAIEKASASGATYVRTHVGVDHSIGTDTMKACLEAKERTADLVDLQLVPASYGGITAEGGEEQVREAIEMGLSAVDDERDVLIGGADPGSRNRDIPRTIETWFDVATDYDIDLDVHIQDHGTLGHRTLDQLVTETRARGYEGRVTASHCFSLAQASPEQLDTLLDAAQSINLKMVTCYNSVRYEMPLREIVGAGIPLGHGTDNTRDFVLPSGDGDTLFGLAVMAQKLIGADPSRETYRWTESNAGYDFLWDLATYQGAVVLGIDDEYGIAEGSNADLVVFDEPSRQWAAIGMANREYVLKNGQIVVEDGEILPEYRASS